MTQMAPPKLTVKELERLLSTDSPKLFNPQSGLAIETVWHGGCRVRRHFDPRSVRSGGTLSGPTMMMLADFAMYVAVLGSIGWVPAAVYLFNTGPARPAIGLSVYGIVVISGIDNLIKPLILKGAANIHPLPAFLSILGGLITFGPLGFLIGPVILSLVLSAIRIYRADVLRDEPALGSGVP